VERHASASQLAGGFFRSTCDDSDLANSRREAQERSVSNEETPPDRRRALVIENIDRLTFDPADGVLVLRVKGLSESFVLIRMPALAKIAGELRRWTAEIDAAWSEYRADREHC
jgi:hypothetical protein